MGSKDPNQWLKWLDELENEEEEGILGEADPTEDDGDYLEESVHDSESEQETEECEDEVARNRDTDEGSVPFYLGKDGSTQWRKHCPPTTRTKAHNLCGFRPGLLNKAASAKSVLECVECFLSENIVEVITISTNIYINHIKANYQRDRDAKSTDTCEIRDEKQRSTKSKEEKKTTYNK
ncbi:hypothetical protein MML48_4g00009095 [Holotrichia oblita]|uniref:Uncharacterized protein n=1 Tax=Holotrichia oblita TaxID=644536 RepID=A0ACB9TAM5_HOLOL|nr:hypothetical protein MML48_4g00009095 [Holotrichia oblita]